MAQLVIRNSPRYGVRLVFPIKLISLALSAFDRTIANPIQLYKLYFTLATIC